MPCYRPLSAWRSRHGGVTFKIQDAFVDRPLELPCGQCIGCRLERSRQWAVRCMHELKYHDESCFLTLTYDDEHLPPGMSLCKADVQKFLKRMRRRVGKFRYFYCGEYGERTKRPHYHMIVFGYDFDDKKFYNFSGDNRLYSSRVLATLWPHGFSSIGACTFDSCAYVARYVTKKITGSDAAAHYGSRLPEYINMSLRPAIGRLFADDYSEQILRHGYIYANGHKQRPPRYYEKIYDAAGGDKKMQLDEIKRGRIINGVERDRLDDRIDKLRIGDVVANAKANLYKRDFDDA